NFVRLSADVTQQNFVPPPSSANQGAAVRSGLTRTRALFSGLADKTKNVPLVGKVFKKLGTPTSRKNQADGGDPDSPAEAGGAGTAGGGGLLGRLRALRSGTVHSSALGVTVTDPQAIRQFLDNLDNVPGNVTLTQSPTDIRYDVRIDKVLEAGTDFDLSLLGG